MGVRLSPKAPKIYEQNRKEWIMFGFFYKVDNRLMDFFEKVSRKIQEVTGYSCLMQALFSMIPYLTAFYIAVNGNGINDGTLKKIFAELLQPLLIFLWSGLEYLGAERKVGDALAKEARNPLCIQYKRIRIFSLLFLGMNGFFSIFCFDISRGFLQETTPIIMAGSLLLFFYLISCTPLPPGKSKARKLIESLAGSLKKLVTENPV